MFCISLHLLESLCGNKTALLVKIRDERWFKSNAPLNAVLPVVFCFVFSELLVFTDVVSLHSLLRYVQAPHHGFGAAGG